MSNWSIKAAWVITHSSKSIRLSQRSIRFRSSPTHFPEKWEKLHGFADKPLACHL